MRHNNFVPVSHILSNIPTTYNYKFSDIFYMAQVLCLTMYRLSPL
jgi:hypothetical protein